MIAIREIQEVKSGSVTIDLPNTWRVKRVEIIILPVEETSNDDKSLSELLLEAPTLTEDDLQDYETAREWMNQWHIEEF